MQYIVGSEAGCSSLLLLRPDPLHALDLQRGLAALFGDLAVLVGDGLLGRFVAVEAAEDVHRHAAVRALRTVHISDVEEGEFAFDIGTGFLGHARLVGDAGARVKANARRACMPSTTWQRGPWADEPSGRTQSAPDDKLRVTRRPNASLKRRGG